MEETAMWAVPRVILLLVYRVTMKATCVVAPFTFVPAADGAFEPTLATEANNCAVEACDSRQRVSAIIRLSMAPNQPVLDLCQLKQSAVRQHVLHTEQSITD